MMLISIMVLKFEETDKLSRIRWQSFLIKTLKYQYHGNEITYDAEIR